MELTTAMYCSRFVSISQVVSFALTGKIVPTLGPDKVGHDFLLSFFFVHHTSTVLTETNVMLFQREYNLTVAAMDEPAHEVSNSTPNREFVTVSLLVCNYRNRNLFTIMI